MRGGREARGLPSNMEPCVVARVSKLPIACVKRVCLCVGSAMEG